MPELTPAELLQEHYRSAADEHPDPDGLAAALEALADQVVPDFGRPSADSLFHLNQWSKSLDQYAQRQQTRSEILTIAAELRGESTTTEKQP